MKLRLSLVMMAVIMGVILVGAANIAHGVDIATSIPGSNPITTSTSPSAFIANFYQYALSIAGILAFGIIVYGGVKYMVSAGNPSGQGDAKEWIKAAIMGILLLAGAYMILNVVNPNLVKLDLPSLLTVSAPASTARTQTSQVAQGTVWCSTNISGQCPNASDGRAQECVDAGTAINHDYSCQPTGSGQVKYTCGDVKLGHSGTCAPGYECAYNGDYYCLNDNN